MNNKTNNEIEEIFIEYATCLNKIYGDARGEIVIRQTAIEKLRQALSSERQKLRKEIEKIDTLPCLCNKNPFDKLCEYNKGFQKAIDGIINLLEE